VTDVLLVFKELRLFKELANCESLLGLELPLRRWLIAVNRLLVFNFETG